MDYITLQRVNHQLKCLLLVIDYHSWYIQYDSLCDYHSFHLSRFTCSYISWFCCCRNDETNCSRHMDPDLHFRYYDKRQNINATIGYSSQQFSLNNLFSYSYKIWNMLSTNSIWMLLILTYNAKLSEQTAVSTCGRFFHLMCSKCLGFFCHPTELAEIIMQHPKG